MKALLGGSWETISGVRSPLVGVIIIVTLLITPLAIAHEPASTLGLGFGVPYFNTCVLKGTIRK